MPFMIAIGTLVLWCLAMLGPAAALDAPSDGKTAVAAPGLGLARWIDPATAPFIPVPVIGNDPNSGTTLGILPTWIHTNDDAEISRIIAPDLIHNSQFGLGADARIFSYPSDNEQWSALIGAQQRIQRIVDLEYQSELSRTHRWSINYSFIYNRDGSPRFFGIGNHSVKAAESSFTRVLQMAQVQVGLNLSHAWQLQYTFRPERVDVQPGTLNSLASIDARYAHLDGLGSNSLILNRLALVYDTRDNLVVPQHGVQLVAYGGLASRTATFGDARYTETGVDARAFASLTESTVLATHASLRYLIGARDVPFWALSSLGGDRVEIGGAQVLRGYGAGRFYDKNSLAASAELRHTMFSFDAGGSHVDVEASPFIEVGKVFADGGAAPLSHLHSVVGLGFRGVAKPFVVGYVDFGYGNEGVAVFTGINYPF